MTKCRKNVGNQPAPYRGLSGESPESVRRVLLDFFRTFGDSFGVPRGRHFQDFFGISSLEGPREPCKRRAGSPQKMSEKCPQFWSPRKQKIGVKNFWFGKSKRGLTLKPQIFRENRAKILPGRAGLFGPDWSLFRAYRGVFGAGWDRFLRTSQPLGGSRNSPERAFLGPIGAFLG